MFKRLKNCLAWIFALTMLLQSVSSANVIESDTKKFGLLSYSYECIFPKYTPTNVNIGDYIQSLAAKQFFPDSYEKVLIDRDKLGLYKGPKVKLIMNSWYFINKNNKAFSNNIDPIFVSLHIQNTEDITQETIDYLKKHEPIGCRDYATSVALAKRGVKTYFSSCLTTTLDEKYKAPDNERTDEIIFCDYKFGSFPKADSYLKSLKRYNFNKVTYTYHDNFSKELKHEERFKIAEELLRKYARAKLVVTSRIHCALPCLALGTPVILVREGYDEKRFGGLYALLNTIGLNEKGEFEAKVNVDENGNVFNSKDYIKYAEKLKLIVRNKIST